MIGGRILDERYTRMLMARIDLDLCTIILLDKVQKRQRITPEELLRLKKAKLVEGRYPNVMVSGSVAAATGQQAKHIRDRGFDNKYYQDLIVELITRHHSISREEIDRLMIEKLPEILTEAQKRSKIHNLLMTLSRTKKVIKNVGSRKQSQWILAEKPKNS